MRFKSSKSIFIYHASETLEFPAVHTVTIVLLFLIWKVLNYKLNGIIGAGTFWIKHGGVTLPWPGRSFLDHLLFYQAFISCAVENKKIKNTKYTIGRWAKVQNEHKTPTKITVDHQWWLRTVEEADAGHHSVAVEPRRCLPSPILPSESDLASGLILVISPAPTHGIHFGTESLQPTLTANSGVAPLYNTAFSVLPAQNYVSQLKCWRHTCAIIMVSSQHLDMTHLWGGWIIFWKCSLTQI